MFAWYVVKRQDTEKQPKMYSLSRYYMQAHQVQLKKVIFLMRIAVLILRPNCLFAPIVMMQMLQPSGFAGNVINGFVMNAK